MPIKYPEQSEYVKGNKIWLELGNDQELIVSSQAREVLKFYGVNEEKFVSKLKDLLKECFTDLEEIEGFVYSFHTLSVSKASLNYDDETPHIRIDIYDNHGKKRF